MTGIGERQGGFTLIELSIVLVVIGLVVGGVLAGQDMIRSASMRATITQLQQYQTAVNTFRGKYNALPGDLNAATAAQFGFAARGLYAGEGDGNGVIECNWDNQPGDNGGYFQGCGETGMFWSDLSYANGMNINLIPENFLGLSAPNWGSINATGTQIAQYMPPAKIGGNSYIYVWSGGAYGTSGKNYFGLSAVSMLQANAILDSVGTSLTVSQAYSIDKKVDDGMPLSGNVMAMFINYGPQWVGTSIFVATPASLTTCYDNNNTFGVVQQYSMNQNSGAGVNCALSFKFQ